MNTNSILPKIRQEIERRINILTNVYAEQVERKDEEMMNYYHGKVIALEELRPFLDTLSEEPDKNLEEAAYKYSFDSRPSIYGQVDVIDAFKAGAEWQASQMPMPEDTVLFNKGVAEGRRLEREDMLRDAEKDLGWHLSTEHPPVDEEVIVLVDNIPIYPTQFINKLDAFPIYKIAFGHIVNIEYCKDYDGWNIPGVKYWMPMPKLPKEDEK